jgi:hypothetical protein
VIGRKQCNSQIISESIFSKYTYNRFRRLQDLQQKYIDKLNSDSFDATDVFNKGKTPRDKYILQKDDEYEA